MTVSVITPSHNKFPWISTGIKAALFMFKNRIKAPRVVPAPSTGDPAVDETTRREFERVREQLNAEYQDQRALLSDLEPLLYEMSDQVQSWMAYRDEQMMNMLMMAMRGAPAGSPALPGTSLPPPAGPAPAPVPDYGAQNGSAYEGQLIKGEGADAIYKVEGGRKRWILSPDAFNRAGFKWDAVRTIPRQVVDSIPFGANIT